MSLKSIIANSECKDFKNRSNKLCCCGCHSKKDVKKNLNHHSTFMKESYKKNRELKYSLNGIEC